MEVITGNLNILKFKIERGHFFCPMISIFRGMIKRIEMTPFQPSEYIHNKFTELLKEQWDDGVDLCSITLIGHGKTRMGVKPWHIIELYRLKYKNKVIRRRNERARMTDPNSKMEPVWTTDHCYNWRDNDRTATIYGYLTFEAHKKTKIYGVMRDAGLLGPIPNKDDEYHYSQRVYESSSLLDLMAMVSDTNKTQ